MDSRRKKIKQPKMKQKDYLDMIVRNQEVERLSRTSSFQNSLPASYKQKSSSLNNIPRWTNGKQSQGYIRRNVSPDIYNSHMKQNADPIDVYNINNYVNGSGRNTCRIRRVRRKPEDVDPHRRLSFNGDINSNGSINYIGDKRYKEHRNHLVRASDLSKQANEFSFQNGIASNSESHKKPRSILKKPSGSSVNDFEKMKKYYENSDLVFEHDSSFDYVSPRDVFSRRDRLDDSFNRSITTPDRFSRSTPTPDRFNRSTPTPDRVSINSKVKVRTTQPLVKSSMPSMRAPLHHETASDFGTFLTNKLASIRLKKKSKKKTQDEKRNAHLLDVKPVSNPPFNASKSENDTHRQNVIFARGNGTRRKNSYKMTSDLYY